MGYTPSNFQEGAGMPNFWANLFLARSPGFPVRDRFCLYFSAEDGVRAAASAVRAMNSLCRTTGRDAGRVELGPLDMAPIEEDGSYLEPRGGMFFVWDALATPSETLDAAYAGWATVAVNSGATPTTNAGGKEGGVEA
jgi:hypothetical protein